MLHVCPHPSLPSDAAVLALEYFIWLHIRPISARFMTSGVGLFHRVPGRGAQLTSAACDACSVFKSESRNAAGVPGEL